MQVMNGSSCCSVGNIGETMDPNEFGYRIDVSDNTIHPVLFKGPSRPIDVPEYQIHVNVKIAPKNLFMSLEYHIMQ